MTPIDTPNKRVPTNMVDMSRAEIQSIMKNHKLGIVPLMQVNTPLQSIEVDLATIPDLEINQTIRIPRFWNLAEKERLIEKFSQPGFKGVEFGGLNEDRLKRLEKATYDCRLPPILAVYVIDHPEIDLNNFMPTEEDPETTILGFGGWSRSGKSTMLAIEKYILQEKLPGVEMAVYCFDNVSNKNADSYCELLKNSQEIKEYFEGRTRIENLVEAVGLMCKVINGNFEGTSQEQDDTLYDWSASKAMDGLLQIFATGKKRPAILLADMNGKRWERNEEDLREEHALDILQQEAMTVIQVKRGVPSEEMRKKDIEPETIVDYLTELFAVGVGADMEERMKMAIFRTALKGEIDPFLESYTTAWYYYRDPAMQELMNLSEDVQWMSL